MEKQIDSKYEEIIFLLGLGTLGNLADEVIKREGLDESHRVDIINTILEDLYQKELNK
ncbi:Uncharacterised protein [Streptococcus pneumoniae]|nr:Uncharacterised protein [Streptococcus pneumoniae]